jgi:hypothetical protein
LRPQLGALVSPAIKRPIKIDAAPFKGGQVPATLAAFLATDAKLLFFGRMVLFVMPVVFSEKRAGRISIITGLAVRGIIVFHVKKGRCVRQPLTAFHAVTIFQKNLLPGPERIPPGTPFALHSRVLARPVPERFIQAAELT